MAREAKFDFIPETQLRKSVRAEETTPVASIRKNGVLTLGVGAIRQYGLEDRWVKLFADVNKKTIAWSIFERDNLNPDLKLRQIKRNSAGVFQLSIGRLLKAIGVEVKDTISNLPVGVYVGFQDGFRDDKKYYYVRVRQPIQDSSDSVNVNEEN